MFVINYNQNLCSVIQLFDVAIVHHSELHTLNVDLKYLQVDHLDKYRIYLAVVPMYNCYNHLIIFIIWLINFYHCDNINNLYWIYNSFVVWYNIWIQDFHHHRHHDNNADRVGFYNESVSVVYVLS